MICEHTPSQGLHSFLYLLYSLKCRAFTHCYMTGQLQHHIESRIDAKCKGLAKWSVSLWVRSTTISTGRLRYIYTTSASHSHIVELSHQNAPTLQLMAWNPLLLLYIIEGELRFYSATHNRPNTHLSIRIPSTKT